MPSEHTKLVVCVDMTVMSLLDLPYFHSHFDTVDDVSHSVNFSDENFNSPPDQQSPNQAKICRVGGVYQVIGRLLFSENTERLSEMGDQVVFCFFFSAEFCFVFFFRPGVVIVIIVKVNCDDTLPMITTPHHYSTTRRRLHADERFCQDIAFFWSTLLCISFRCVHCSLLTFTKTAPSFCETA